MNTLFKSDGKAQRVQKENFALDLLLQMKHMDYTCVKTCCDMGGPELDTAEKDCLKGCLDRQRVFVEAYKGFFDLKSCKLKNIQF